MTCRLISVHEIIRCNGHNRVLWWHYFNSPPSFSSSSELTQCWSHISHRCDFSWLLPLMCFVWGRWAKASLGTAALPLESTHTHTHTLSGMLGPSSLLSSSISLRLRQRSSLTFPTRRHKLITHGTRSTAVNTSWKNVRAIWMHLCRHLSKAEGWEKDIGCIPWCVHNLNCTLESVPLLLHSWWPYGNNALLTGVTSKWRCIQNNREISFYVAFDRITESWAKGVKIKIRLKC